MPPIHLDLHHTEDSRDLIHQAVAAISSGKIVAVPTETVYGLAVSGLIPEAVDRLLQIKQRSRGNPLPFAVQSFDAALDYVPDMSLLAQRLARRCWPGPVTLVLDANHRDSVINRLHPSVIEATIPHGTVGLRVPANEKTLQIMQLCAGPILLTSANLSEQTEATQATEVEQIFGNLIDVIVNDGPCRIGQPSTVVRVEGNKSSILREGVVDHATLESMSHFLGLVVCTGNTCRSPMGEALLRKQMAAKIGCQPDELEKHRINILSAGISALPGAPAAPQANEVMREFGLAIDDHQSQPVTNRLAHYADIILCMTDRHRQAIVTQWPSLANRCFTIRADGCDISDPIGAPIDVYRQCATQIDQEMAAWVDRLDLSEFREIK